MSGQTADNFHTPGSTLESGTQSLQAPPKPTTALPASVCSLTDGVSYPLVVSPTEASFARRPIDPLLTPSNTIRCGRKSRVASLTASLSPIREEPNSHDCAEECALQVPLDAGGHFDSVVEKRFRDPTFALNLTHDVEGKSGDRSNQSVPIFTTRRIIYENNPATSRPLIFRRAPTFPETTVTKCWR